MLLALVLLCGLIPAVTPTAQAAGWAQGYLDTLSGWGVMRGDIQNGLDPDRNITRAEFVAIINRAYGYKDMKGTPFTDVPESAWYADDIDIAHTVGYFNGTSPTTASPNATLTREQAAVLLARNLMLQPTVGETLGFSDSRELSSWSRGLIGAAAQNGVINGYSDGSFRPNGRITRGEVAAMVARSLGTLIKDSGDHSLSSVYGNVTINQPGVNLRNTVIVGNLYLTGGIGLGDVLLENVAVYGQIIVAGAGESNASHSSVILRNVTSNKLVVDNISNQFVTVRAEGDTDIAQTSIRTNAYVEDTTPDGYGLKLIEIDGENGIRVQLAGNTKEVVNLTPESSLQIVQGSAKKVTIDEKATNSTVNIYSGARIDELNLDVSTSVSGEGDIGHLQIGAPDCTISMLPDEITIRPGLSATINGVLMDNNTASESSADPRLLAGYPSARNIAPTSATLVASTNKAGTVYWAITALADGSVGEDDVIKPPVYGGKILLSGNISATKSKTEYTAELSKLTSDGSYYISSIMVDGRGNRSPLKVTAFSTPDDTVPAFTTGYPVMTKNTTERSQVTVMANKSCQMYYALLSGGSQMPTTQELKAGAVKGNWGYGVVDLVKNSTQPVNINSVTLEELTNYDLYLWLTDYDGAKSSTVRKITFKTPDETPPEIVDIIQTDSQETSVKMAYSLSESGTLYYAVVPEGNESFMIYDLDTVEARVKVESGVGASRSGNSSTRAANTSTTFNITGLNSASSGTLGISSYDLYYVVKDAAGNYSSPVQKMNIRTRDVDAPDVSIEFTKFNGDDKDAPLADTDIRLVFTESVQGGAKGDKIFLDLYNKVATTVGEEQKRAKEDLGNAIRDHFTLYTVTSGSRPEPVVERNEANEDTDENKKDWVVDYRNVKVTMEDGKMVITFPTAARVEDSAINLDSGVSYYFRVEGIYDNAITPNAMGSKQLDFRTVYAQVSLSNADLTKIDATMADGTPRKDIRVDFSLNMQPISTSKVDETERWDLIMWCDNSIQFNVYYQEVGGTGGWKQLGKTSRITVNSGTQFSGTSLRYGVEGSPEYYPLKDLDEKKTYQYAIELKQVNDLSDENMESWSELVQMRFGVIAGGSNNVGTVSANVDRNYDEYIKNGDITSIGLAYSTGGMTDILTLRKQFTDRTAPSFLENSPRFEAGSSTIHMELNLDREGTIYYVVAPAGDITTTVRYNNKASTIDSSNDGTNKDGTLKDKYEKGNLTYIPWSGGDRVTNKGDVAYAHKDKESIGYELPTYLNIVNPRYGTDAVKTGSVRFTGVQKEVDVSGLKPTTDPAKPMVYYVYFVLQGGGEYYSLVECYKVEMDTVKVPAVNVNSMGSTSVAMTPSEESQLSYALVEYNALPSIFKNLLEGTGMTVLEAMSTRSGNTNGKSVFDEKANPAIKLEVSQYILGTGVIPPANAHATIGTANAKANESISKDFAQWMESENSEYVVLAVGRHIYGGTGGNDYGFGAARGLYQQDQIAPEYNGGQYIQLVIDGVYQGNNTTNLFGSDVNWGENPHLYSYSGRISVGFTKPIYLFEPSDSTNYGVVVSSTPGAKNKTMGSVLGGTAKDKFDLPLSTATTSVTNEFVLYFNKLTTGDSLTFFNSGLISNASSFTTNKKLTLSFDTSLRMSDYRPNIPVDMAWPGFRATWQ